MAGLPRRPKRTRRSAWQSASLMTCCAQWNASLPRKRAARWACRSSSTPSRCTPPCEGRPARSSSRRRWREAGARAGSARQSRAAAAVLQQALEAVVAVGRMAAVEVVAATVRRRGARQWRAPPPRAPSPWRRQRAMVTSYRWTRCTALGPRLLAVARRSPPVEPTRRPWRRHLPSPLRRRSARRTTRWARRPR